MRTKRWCIALLVIVFSFTTIGFTVACAQKEPMETVEKPTLTIWDWHSTETPDIMKEVYGQFEQQTGIKLDVETLMWDDCLSKISTATEAGQLPDLMEINANFLLPPMVAKGRLEPLDKYIEQEGGSKFLEKFKPNCVLPVDGQVYALPILLWKHDLIYNPNLLGDNKPPTNWQELEDLCKLLTDKDKGIYGFGIPGATAETLLYFEDFISQNGGYVGLPAGSTRVPEKVSLADIGINKPEAIQAIEFALNLVKEYGPPFANASVKQIRDEFTAGNIAMMYEGTDAIVFLAFEGMTFEIQTASMPIGPVGKPAAANDYGNDQFAMSADCKNKEAAWEFLKFITNDESQIALTEGIAMVAATKGEPDKALLSVQPRTQPSIESLGASEPDWYVLDAYSTLPPQVRMATDIFNTEIQAAAMGNKSIQEAMDNVAKNWIGLWDEWRSKYGASK